MKVFHGELTRLPLPPRHRFPVVKYTVLRDRLLERGLFRRQDLKLADPASIALIASVHDSEYVDAFLEGRLDRRVLSRIGLPWSEALVKRALTSVGATVEATGTALEDGISASLGGGTHHAYRSFGAGYCVLNDLAIGVRAVLDAGRATRALIFDADVHQGDGTAAIFSDDPTVFTCSIHGASCFPARKQRSDLDIPLPDGATDEGYLAAITEALERSFELARPELVLYQAGVDILASDTLGTLAVTPAGVAARDRLVFEAARQRGVPIAFTLGGGYGKPLETTIEAHLGIFHAALELFGFHNVGKES